MRGILGGLALGFLGAGLFGMLFGGGFLSGLAGFASILGFIAQIALIAGVVFLAYRWWQRRSQPQPSYAGMPREMTNEQPMQRSALGGFGGFGGSGGNAAPAIAPLEVKGEDFDTFERLLGEVQTAYGREDLAALRSSVTPEMLSYYAEDFSENASRGVINEISDVKLLQGDLAESWREDGKEYASVAMRYSLRDRFVDRDDRPRVGWQRSVAGGDRSVDLHAGSRAATGCSRRSSRRSSSAQHEHEKPGSDAGLFVWRVANACSVLVADPIRAVRGMHADDVALVRRHRADAAVAGECGEALVERSRSRSFPRRPCRAHRSAWRTGGHRLGSRAGRWRRGRGRKLRRGREGA